MPKLIRVASLLRVSTTKVEQEESPEAQLAYIREEIRRRSSTEAEVWMDTGSVYQDELTGALVLERPDVQRALADARAGRYDLLAMKSISRMGRDTLGLLSFKRHLDDLDVELAALQDGYRSSRDLELIFLVHADRAQHGRLEISKNVSTNMRQKAIQGKWVAGTVPFGYRRKNRHQLEPHPETAPIARLIFDLRLQGEGSTSIARRLNEMRIPAPSWWYFQDILPRWEHLAITDERWAARLADRTTKFARPASWSTRGVLLILRNTAYKGELCYNRIYFRRRLGGRLTRESRPATDWITIPCPPLVTPAEFGQAQSIDRRKIARKRQTSPYLLTGLLYCGQCGGRMSGSGRMDRNGTFYGYYQCRNRREARTCKAPRVRADRLEADLLAHLRQRLASLAPQQPSERTTNAQRSPDLARQWKAQLADLADERRYYRAEHRKGRVPDAELEQELQRIARAESLLQAELQTHTAAGNPLPRSADHQRNLHLQTARLQAHGLTHPQLRQLLSLAIEKIEITTDGGLDIYWRFASNVLQAEISGPFSCL